VIRPPRSDELERLREIEREAGRLFVDVGMPEIAADEPPPLAVLGRRAGPGSSPPTPTVTRWLTMGCRSGT
jgi:hypothetical protein